MGGGGHLQNNAFTLTELIGVVIILGIISLLAFPPILNAIRSTKGKISDASKEILYNAVGLYVSDNINNYPKYNGNKYCVTVNELVKGEYLPTTVYDSVTGNEIPQDSKIEINIENDIYSYNLNNDCHLIFRSGPIKKLILLNFPYLEVGENGCKNPVDNNYSYMGGCYLKGNQDKNYVWYSGFLWRIMGINEDGTIKLIVDENVTAIPYAMQEMGENWDESYAKDWLNNYFYPRLEENNIISEQVWCSETTTNSSSTRMICIDNLSTKKAHVGLISLDEYNLAGASNSYLNIKTSQYFITPRNNSTFWYALDSGIYYGLSIASGLKPVININPNVIIEQGDGSLTEYWDDEIGPYILNKKENIKTDSTLSELGTSGEYVLFSGKKYRIVDKDNTGNIKLILDGYYEENGDIYTIKYGANNIFYTTTGIGQKLNNDVLEWLVASNDTINRNKIVNDYTWYQNYFSYASNYKVSLEEKNPTRKITSPIGLIRIGEMLSGQSGSITTNGYTQLNDPSNAATYWTITTINNAYSAHYINAGANANYSSNIDEYHAIRPVIVIKSDVQIVTGIGTWSNPYCI